MLICAAESSLGGTLKLMTVLAESHSFRVTLNRLRRVSLVSLSSPMTSATDAERNMPSTLAFALTRNVQPAVGLAMTVSDALGKTEGGY